MQGDAERWYDKEILTGWTPVTYLALYDTDRSSPAVRERFLAQVTCELAKF